MERRLGGRAVTAQHVWRRLALADDGIIDLIAVEIAACGTRPVALTPAERQLAASRILSRGGLEYALSGADAWRGITTGIWGGTTPRERSRLRQARKAAAA
jgi:hypothetical protein